MTASTIPLRAALYRRDHLRALAQRVEVADGEVRIMGSKTRLLQALTGKSGVNSVPTQGLKWRRECPSDHRFLTFIANRRRLKKPRKYRSFFHDRPLTSVSIRPKPC